MSAGASYTCEPQQRLLKLITLLAGNEVTGLAPGEIAKLQGCSASVATRDLANLAEGGFAERVPETGLWRLGPAPVQVGIKHLIAIDTAARRLEEIRHRFTRGVGATSADLARTLDRYTITNKE
jgi:DNA-binding IclR family transcriptional regulator